MTELDSFNALRPGRIVNWNVALIASRETRSTLTKALLSVVAAAAGRQTVIDVLVNGRRELVEAMVPVVQELSLPLPISVRLWFVPLGDKAHAWNVFVHELYIPGSTAFFIDGYALANADAFERMQTAFDADKEVVAVSGVPTVGHSARRLAAALVETGGLHGNLHAVAADAMADLRSHVVKLPLGLYRVDGLAGAVLRYRCDPGHYDWGAGKIVVDPAVSWGIAGAGMPWGIKNLAGLFKRRLRQAQGELENRAMRHHLTVNRRPANEMAKTISGLVQRWMTEQPEEAQQLLSRRFLVLHAAKVLSRSKDWSEASIPHQLILKKEQQCGIES